MLAAEVAQQRGDEARANQHLERAAELAGNDTIPVEIHARAYSRRAMKSRSASPRTNVEVTPRSGSSASGGAGSYRTAQFFDGISSPSMAKAHVKHSHRAMLDQQADRTYGSGARRAGSEGRRTEKTKAAKNPPSGGAAGRDGRASDRM